MFLLTKTKVVYLLVFAFMSSTINGNNITLFVKAEEKGLPLEIPISTETFRHTRKKVGVKTSYGYYKVSKKTISAIRNGIF